MGWNAPAAEPHQGQVAAFLQTPDGKHWLRGRRVFDSVYRGMLRNCEQIGA